MPLLRTLSSAIVRRRRVLLTSVVLLVLLGGIAAEQLARRDLRNARAQRREAVGERDRSRLELAEHVDRLTSAQAELARRTTARDEFQLGLDTARTELAAVQGQISNTAARVSLTGPQIELLGRCLNGVSAALNQSSVADPGALATLQSSQATCNEAAAALSATP